MVLKASWFIHIVSNIISFIEVDAISNLTEMQYLNLRYNFIRDHDSNLFSPADKINVLILSHNKPEIIKENFFTPHVNISCAISWRSHENIFSMYLLNFSIKISSFLLNFYFLGDSLIFLKRISEKKKFFFSRILKKFKKTSSLCLKCF